MAVGPRLFAKQMRVITTKELAKHATETDCWVAVQGTK